MDYQEFVDFCKKNTNKKYIHIPNLKGLEKLPPEIRLLKELRQMLLIDAKVTMLPKEFGDLKNLEYLRILNTPLEHIPQEIQQLEKLFYLELVNVPIADFSFLALLPNLKSLILKHCRLNEFPPELLKIKNLQFLQLDNNNICSFPDWFGQLSTLTRLDISNNPLQRIFFEGDNSALKYLRLENCELTSIPETIGELTQLRTLVLKKNKLKELPYAINKLAQLDQLNVSKNPLETFPKMLSGLKKLRYFQFDERWVNEFPYSTLQLSSLSKLTKHKSISTRAKEIPSLAKEVNKRGYSNDFAHFLMDILAERWKKIEAIPKYEEYLLEALNTSIVLIQNSVLAIISSRYLTGNHQLINADTVVCVLGKTAFNLNELKTRLKALGMVASHKSYFIDRKQFIGCPK